MSENDRVPTKLAVLSRATLVPLGMVLGAATTVFFAGMFAAQMSSNQAKIMERLEHIESTMKIGLTHQEFDAWIRLSRALNGAKVEFPDSPRK